MKIRKIVATIAACVLLPVTSTASASSTIEQPTTVVGSGFSIVNQRFTDNPEGSLFYSSIEWMANEGITVGYPNGTFGKDRTASRGETVAFLHRYLGSPSANSAYLSYRDMRYGDLFSNAVAWASQEGVSGGYPDGTFRPTANVSRSEFATFIYRLSNRSFSSPRGAEFSDISSSAFYFNAVNWMRCYGISGGYGDGSFKPAQSITRGEMSAMLHRYHTLSAQGALSGGCTTSAPKAPVNSKEVQRAVQAARSYLEWSGFSRSGLIDQLEYEGFSNAVATKAVDSLDLNWTSQAKKKAQSYLEWGHFSRSELIHQLEFEGFSSTQATRAVDLLDVNWKQQAVKAARSYIENELVYTRSRLIEQLVSDGFSQYEAEYAAGQVGW